MTSTTTTTPAFAVIDSTSSPVTYSSARLRRHVSDCVGEPGTRYRKAWDSSVLSSLSSIGATIEIGDPGADYQNGEVEVLLMLPDDRCAAEAMDPLAIARWLCAVSTGYNLARS